MMILVSAVLNLIVIAENHKIQEQKTEADWSIPLKTDIEKKHLWL